MWHYNIEGRGQIRSERENWVDFTFTECEDTDPPFSISPSSSHRLVRFSIFLICAFDGRMEACVQGLPKKLPVRQISRGHMRSHFSGNHSSAQTEHSLASASATGYDLREQRKKTWRVSDSSYGGGIAESSNKLCKQCGKGFHSWKALFGHMKCHSHKERVSVTANNDDNDNSLEDQDSWTVMDSQSDNEAPRPRTRTRSKRTRTTTTSSLSFSNVSSSVSEIEQEQEEVALCLMMLSRGSPEIGSEKKPRRSEILIPDHRSGFRKRKTMELDFQSAMEDPEEDDKEQGKRNFKLLGSELNSNPPCKSCHRRGKFECTICNKFFQSYQALGGHRASHKKIARDRDCFVSKDETSKNSIKPELSHHEAISGSDLHEDDDAEFDKSDKNHECSICLKSFPSGEALDEHKRSHIAEVSDLIEEPVEKIRELIDLNAPAEEEESNNNGNSECYRSSSAWWVRSIHNKQEALVGI